MLLLWMVAKTTRNLHWMRTCLILLGCFCLQTLSTERAQETACRQDFVPTTRVAIAKASALNPRHVKLEHMCSKCFGCSISAGTLCRFCSVGTADGVTRSMLAIYEPSSEVPTREPPGNEQPALTGTDVAMTDTSLVLLMLNGPCSSSASNNFGRKFRGSNDTFSSCRKKDKVSCGFSRKKSGGRPGELLARKPEGQTLEQAIAKHEQACKARQIAENDLDKAKENLQLATAAFEQTKVAEEAAAQGVQKQRSAICDFEPSSTTASVLPGPTMVGLYPPACRIGRRTSSSRCGSAWHKPSSQTPSARQWTGSASFRAPALWYCRTPGTGPGTSGQPSLPAPCQWTGRATSNRIGESWQTNSIACCQTQVATTNWGGGGGHSPEAPAQAAGAPIPTQPMGPPIGVPSSLEGVAPTL